MNIAYRDAINEIAFTTEDRSNEELACAKVIAALFVYPLGKIREDLDKKRATWAARKAAEANPEQMEIEK